MARQQNHKQVSRGIYRRTSASGQAYYLTWDGVDTAQKPIWKKHATLEQATEHRRQVQILKRNEGRHTFGLTARQREDAARALELLKPYPDARLVHAAAHYAELLQRHTSKTVRETVTDLLARKESLRPASLKSLGHRLGKLVDAFGDRKLAEVTVEDMQRFVDGSGCAPRTKIGFAVAASQLWTYAQKRRWVAENVAALIERPKPDDTETLSYSVDECQRLLNAALSSNMLAYVAIGLFCGVRRQELCRLSALKRDRKAIDLAARTVAIDQDIAKKRSRRIIDIQHPTLCGWLAPHLAKTGLLPGSTDDTTVNELLQDLAKRAGVPWIVNGLRHSYASYHLAKYKDVARLAYYMGEKDATVIYNHYASLRTAAEAERFWNLQPAP